LVSSPDSSDTLIPAFWQLIIQIGLATGVIIAIATATYKIVNAYRDVKEALNVAKTDLEGKIKVLETTLSHHKDNIDTQKSQFGELQKQLLRSTVESVIKDLMPRENKGEGKQSNER
jgi:hypothetical protein